MNPPKYRTGRYFVQLGNAVSWFRNQKFLSIGLTSSQSEVIRYVLKHRNERITAGDLMTQLSLSQSTVAGIIKRMENKSLLTRYMDDADARKSIIAPMEEGLLLEESLKKVAEQTEDIILQGMSDAEQAELNRLLKIALSNLSTYRASVSTEGETTDTGNCAND
ncbi:MAG: MarR family winged helix-turn-helix transcriptional regulator [Candidatus Paceibacterota bacterium]|jgi:MarR family multiple gene transcriptional regulator MgrA